MLYHWSLCILFFLSHTYLHGSDQYFLDLLDNTSDEYLMGLDDYTPKRSRTGLTPDPSPCRDPLFEHMFMAPHTSFNITPTMPEDRSIAVESTDVVRRNHSPMVVEPAYVTLDTPSPEPSVYIDICSPDEDNPVQEERTHDTELTQPSHEKTMQLLWEQRFKRLEDSVVNLTETMTSMSKTLHDVAQQVALLQQTVAQQSAKRTREEITPAVPAPIISSSSATLVEPVVTLAQRMHQIGETLHHTLSDMHALEQATVGSSSNIRSLSIHPLYLEWTHKRPRVRPDTLSAYLNFIEEFRRRLPAELRHPESNFTYRLTLEKAIQYLRAYDKREPLPPGQLDSHFYLRSGYNIFITVNPEKISKFPCLFEGKILPSLRHLYGNYRTTFYKKLVPIFPDLACTLAILSTS